jgi:3-oxoacyl-[acyl-carrier protein] reductase
MRIVKKLDGKAALVTGAGRGIGRSIALKLAADGARLVLNDLDEAPLLEVAAEIKALGSEAELVPGSVTAPDFGDRFVKAALDRFGDLHIIVNNAGYTWDSVIQKMSDEQFDAVMDVHLKAPFRILRAAAEPIRVLSKREAEQGKRVVRKVVNISSVAGTTGNPGQSNYAAAKAAIIGLTKTLSKEWGRYRVAVNTVAFGYIQTRMTKAFEEGDTGIEIDGRNIKMGVPAAAVAEADKLIPLGRGGTPDEAAGAVYLFCIPESDYISGQTIVCGGGMGAVA